MKVKEESEQVGLKLSIWKTKIMASGPITSWQIDGKTQEEEPCDNNKCGKTFQKAQNTIQQRTDVRKKTCKCDKAPGKSAITEQQKKLYVYDECKKSFHQISALKLSQSTHTWEKPYQCKDCWEILCEIKSN